ncbi:MAG: exodeoxyribonuclease VII large subunit [Prochlorothrix sp.]|nr:exodeoxyribonuclease VII large subunit [Prochlorothrix sp.]
MSFLASTPQSALTVAGLTHYLQDILEEDPHLRQAWVLGEVSSVSPHAKGFFFTLQDPQERVGINCVIWKGQQHKLAGLPEVGEQVLVLGSVRLFTGRSQYQLVVWQWLPAGEGLQALRLRQLRQRLEAEGVFDPVHKQRPPEHPRVVAVVTSREAAAWGDIQRTLRSRYPGLRVLFAPAQVQGQAAPEAIVDALGRIEADGRAEVILLSRGGGAKEDLACFNDERVVRAVALCRIPIIAGIGHQRDESLADLAADVCAHTPTAAAAIAVPNLADLRADYEDQVAQLRWGMTQQLQVRQIQLQVLQQRLQRQAPDRQLQHDRQQLDTARQRLVQAMRQQLRQEGFRCRSLGERLTGLDPTAVLQRGYAVLRRESGEIVRDAETVATGDRLRIQVAQGVVTVRVEEAEPESVQGSVFPSCH